MIKQLRGWVPYSICIFQGNSLSLQIHNLIYTDIWANPFPPHCALFLQAYHSSMHSLFPALKWVGKGRTKMREMRLWAERKINTKVILNLCVSPYRTYLSHSQMASIPCIDYQTSTQSVCKGFLDWQADLYQNASNLSEFPLWNIQKIDIDYMK